MKGGKHRGDQGVEQVKRGETVCGRGRKKVRAGMSTPEGWQWGAGGGGAVTAVGLGTNLGQPPIIIFYKLKIVTVIIFHV